jgi:DNA-binding response OmpR family regulator
MNWIDADVLKAFAACCGVNLALRKGIGSPEDPDLSDLYLMLPDTAGHDVLRRVRK